MQVLGSAFQNEESILDFGQPLHELEDLSHIADDHFGKLQRRVQHLEPFHVLKECGSALDSGLKFDF
eukprot:441946-Rhodomonas_salina.4